MVLRLPGRAKTIAIVQDALQKTIAPKSRAGVLSQFLMHNGGSAQRHTGLANPAPASTPETAKRGPNEGCGGALAVSNRRRGELMIATWGAK